MIGTWCQLFLLLVLYLNRMLEGPRARRVWCITVAVSVGMWVVYIGLFGLSDAGWLRLCKGKCKADWLFASRR